MRSFLLLMAKAAAALICAAVLWEMIARSLIASIVWVSYTPALGHFHAKGTTLITNEGFARSSYDETGYRGGLPEIRPKHVILAIGDSLTEAAQVPDSDTFCAQAASILRKSGIDAYVANAGFAGGSPSRYVAVAPWYTAHLHPERVIVQLDQGDFVSDLPNQTGDFWIMPTSKGFRLLPAPHRSGPFEKLEASHIPAWAKSAIKSTSPTSLLQLALNAATGAVQEAGGPASGTTSDKQVSFTPYVQWSVEALKNAYKDPILLFLPDIDYFKPEQPTTPEEAALILICKQDGVTLIDMRSTFLSYFEQTGQCASGFSNTLPGEGHMNSLGHRLVAQALVSALRVGREK
jgi:hypothetical protein